MHLIIISPLLQFDIIALMMHAYCMKHHMSCTITRSIESLVCQSTIQSQPTIYLIVGHQYIPKEVTLPEPPFHFGIYQWEPWKSSSFRRRQDILKRAAFIWDYSTVNLEHYGQFDLSVVPEYKPFLYAHVSWSEWLPLIESFKQLKKTNSICPDIQYYGTSTSSVSKDIDVILIGSFTRQRLRVVRKIATLGLRVAFCTNGMWGDTLKEYIKKSTVMLNLHRVSCNIMELARIMPAISLETVVISEPGQDKELDSILSTAILIRTLDEIPFICHKVCTDTKFRDTIIEQMRSFTERTSNDQESFNIHTNISLKSIQ